MVGRHAAPVPHKTPGSANGRQPGSEPGNLGSNPSPGVLCGRRGNWGSLALSFSKGPGPAVAGVTKREYDIDAMSTQVLIRRLHREMGALRDDLREMKRFLLSPLKDAEGEYRGSFVKKMMARSRGRGPFHRFTTREAFLKHVRSYAKEVIGT